MSVPISFCDSRSPGFPPVKDGAKRSFVEDGVGGWLLSMAISACAKAMAARVQATARNVRLLIMGEGFFRRGLIEVRE